MSYLIAVSVVFSLWAVISVAFGSSRAWRESGHSILVWFLVVLFVPLGWLLYLVFVRPDLKRASRRGAWQNPHGGSPLMAWREYPCPVCGTLLWHAGGCSVAAGSGEPEVPCNHPKGESKPCPHPRQIDMRETGGPLFCADCKADLA